MCQLGERERERERERGGGGGGTKHRGRETIQAGCKTLYNYVKRENHKQGLRLVVISCSVPILTQRAHCPSPSEARSQLGRDRHFVIYNRADTD